MRYFLTLLAAFLGGLLAASTATLSATPNSVKPAHMDYSTQGTSVVSPDGKTEITVTGEKKSLGAWVTINKPMQGWSIQVWPIERDVDVLWDPDSHVFALTDNRYANESYILIIGTEFHMNGPTLGVQRVDLTPLLRQAFASSARQYYRQHYGTTDFDDSYSFYARALLWTSNEHLLVGVSAITSLALPQHALGAAPGVKGWSLGYLLDVPQRKILTVLNEKAVQKQYGIDLSKSALRN